MLSASEFNHFLAELKEMEENFGYVTNPGLYALCLLLDTDSHCIGRATTIIRPFGEETGVILKFDENTFDADETAVDLKVSYHSILQLFQ